MSVLLFTQNHGGTSVCEHVPVCITWRDERHSLSVTVNGQRDCILTSLLKQEQQCPPCQFARRIRDNRCGVPGIESAHADVRVLFNVAERFTRAHRPTQTTHLLFKGTTRGAPATNAASVSNTRRSTESRRHPPPTAWAGSRPGAGARTARHRRRAPFGARRQSSWASLQRTGP